VLLSSVYYFLSNAFNIISVMVNTVLTITLLYLYNVRKCRAKGNRHVGAAGSSASIDLELA